MRSRWVNITLGSWLFISAWLFAREGSSVLSNNIFLGLAIFLVSFLAMAIPAFRRINTMLGLWAVISPFLLGYGDDGAAINDVVVGILVISASVWVERAGTERRRMAEHITS